MPSDGSVTHWIEQIKDGDLDAAASALWERYFEKLVRFARKKLEGRSRRVADEEDVALSAFKSFCQAARAGRFPDLADRDGLWRLLLWITARKAVDLMRYNKRQKPMVLGESVLHGTLDPESTPQSLAEMLGEEATPEFAAIVAEECQRLLELLEDPILQDVAVAKMEGYTNAKIADCSLRTVERQLQLIRRIWKKECQE